jgi:HEAT repeat protein
VLAPFHIPYNDRMRRDGHFVYGTAVALAVGLVALSPACGQKRKPVQRMSQQELLDALADEPNDRVKADVVRRLAAKKDRVSVTALTVALKDDSERVRMAAASALGDSGSEAAVDPLWKAVNDPVASTRFRLNAAYSLAKLGDARAAGPLIAALPGREASAGLAALGEKAVPGLIEALHDVDTRPNAETALIGLGSAAMNPLIETVRNDKSKYARLGAVRVLSEFKDERAQTVIDQVLTAREPEVTVAAYRYLIRSGRPGTETRLISGLNTAGNREMALDFIHSGNPLLKAAGEEWGKAHGAPMTAVASELQPVYWADVDPSAKQHKNP